MPVAGTLASLETRGAGYVFPICHSFAPVSTSIADTTLAEPPVPPLLVCANATSFVVAPIVTWPAVRVRP